MVIINDDTINYFKKATAQTTFSSMIMRVLGSSRQTAENDYSTSKTPPYMKIAIHTMRISSRFFLHMIL